MDTDTPMKLRVTFKAPDFLTARDGRALLRTPFIAQVLGFASRQLSGATTLDTRRFPDPPPLRRRAVHERVNVALPDSVHETLALPADKAIDDANLAFSRTFKRDGQNLTGEFDLRLKRLDIPAADYAGLRDDVREIARAGKRAALLSTDSEVKPDARVLRRKVTVILADEHSLTTRIEERTKVLTYAGKKDNAELKLSWNTSDPEPLLEHATVTDKAGVTHEVSPKEINILDAGWVADAPRYAPSRIKVVSLPAVEEGAIIDVAYTTVSRNLTAFHGKRSSRPMTPWTPTSSRSSRPPASRSSSATTPARASPATGIGCASPSRAAISLRPRNRMSLLPSPGRPGSPSPPSATRPVSPARCATSST